jgi:hypothetical protein
MSVIEIERVHHGTIDERRGWSGSALGSPDNARLGRTAPFLRCRAERGYAVRIDRRERYRNTVQQSRPGVASHVAREVARREAQRKLDDTPGGVVPRRWDVGQFDHVHSHGRAT